MNLQFYLINMANIAANNYKDRKILKRHKNFMLDRLSVRRPNNTRHIEFHAGQCPMSTLILSPDIDKGQVKINCNALRRFFKESYILISLTIVP